MLYGCASAWCPQGRLVGLLRLSCRPWSASHQLCSARALRRTNYRRPRAMSSAEGPPKRPAPSPSFFQEVSGTLTAPWEIGRVQPPIARLVEEGLFDGCRVLDVGCCIGDNTLHVAAHAKRARVTGCDLVERALEVARRKAADAGLAVEFVQQDMTAALEGPLQGAQYDVVLDSALYHVFQPGPSRDAYVANVHRLVKPGGQVVMFVFSDKQPGTDGPVRVSKADILSSYPPPGWTLERIEDAVYECLPFAHGGAAQAYLVVIHRAA